MHDQAADDAALTHFRSRLDTGRFQVGSLHYTIRNALSALGREQVAKSSHIAAFEDSDFSSSSEMAAQCYKNLGTSFERLGEEDIAAEHYLGALRLSPNLTEAHNAVAHYHHRNSRYEEALRYLDRVVFKDQQLGRTSAISDWRIDILFDLGDARAAFREINGCQRRRKILPSGRSKSRPFWRAPGSLRPSISKHGPRRIGRQANQVKIIFRILRDERDAQWARYRRNLDLGPALTAVNIAVMAAEHKLELEVA